jgi:acetyl-CoA carboxylase carboxyltransferase component
MLKQTKATELRKKRIRLVLGGGKSKIRKQHASGKLTARERIHYLMDEGAFVETDAFVSHRSQEFGMDREDAPGDGIVTGYGKVDGRMVFVYAQDFTILGGSLGEMHAMKICKVADLALKTGAPLICLNDSGGARIQEGVDSLNGFGAIFLRNTMASGVIPQISAIMGPCAGGAAYSPALTDFIFMVENTSRLFITGPQVIKAVTGEIVSAEALGGAMTHNAVSGVAHFSDVDDKACLDRVRQLLSYLPANNMDEPPALAYLESEGEMVYELNHVVPEKKNQAYDMKDVIQLIVDADSFFEVQEYFAQNMIIGFARMGGRVIGLVANQPKFYAGCIDINAADKAGRFIRFCDCFNIPIVNLVDVPGFLPGVAQEHNGIIRHGAKMLYAYSEATVPKIIVITRKLYGGAYLAMCSKSMGADQVFAWPDSEIAVMGAEGAANIIGRERIEKSADPEGERRKLIQEYEESFANPYWAASRGYVDAVIKPCETRASILAALQMLRNKREDRPAKKHGSIPL